jgi:mono/diheme cytochrome c family protein
LRTLIIIIALSTLAACDADSPADKYVKDATAVKRGRSIFIGTCMGYCHSLKPARKEAPHLFDCNWLHGGTDQEIFNTISNGVPETKMASYGGKLPEGEQDIWKVIAYINTQRPSC